MQVNSIKLYSKLTKPRANHRYYAAEKKQTKVKKPAKKRPLTGVPQAPIGTLKPQYQQIHDAHYYRDAKGYLRRVWQDLGKLEYGLSEDLMPEIILFAPHNPYEEGNLRVDKLHIHPRFGIGGNPINTLQGIHLLRHELTHLHQMYRAIQAHGLSEFARLKYTAYVATLSDAEIREAFISPDNSRLKNLGLKWFAKIAKLRAELIEGTASLYRQSKLLQRAERQLPKIEEKYFGETLLPFRNYNTNHAETNPAQYHEHSAEMEANRDASNMFSEIRNEEYQSNS